MTSAAAAEGVSASPAKVRQVVSPGGVDALHVQSDLVPLVALAFTLQGRGAPDPAAEPSRTHLAGGRPWGRTGGVAATPGDALLDLHRRVVARGRAKIAVVGAIDAERLATLLDGVFGTLPEPEPLKPVPQVAVAGR